VAETRPGVVTARESEPPVETDAFAGDPLRMSIVPTAARIVHSRAISV